MYCVSCGQRLPDEASFCPICGKTVAAREDPKQVFSYGEIQQDSSAHQDILNAPTNRLADNIEYGMKWYKFLTWGILLIGTIFGVLYAVLAIVSTVSTYYNNDWGYLFSFQDNWLLVGEIVIYIIFVAGFRFLAFVHLKNYSNRSIQMLLICYGVSVAYSLLSGIMLQSIGVERAFSTAIGEVLGNVIILLITVPYMKKRKKYFMYRYSFWGTKMIGS